MSVKIYVEGDDTRGEFFSFVCEFWVKDVSKWNI